MPQHEETARDAAIEAEVERAELACREGDEAGALEALTRLAQLAPGRSGAGLATIRLHRRAGRLRLALRLCRDLLEQAPDHVEIRQELAECLDLVGYGAEARQLHRQLLREQPEAPASWSGLGRLLQREGHSDAAEACLRRALRLDPAHLPALEGLGRLLIRRGETAEASARLRDAIAIAPDPASVQTALARALLAEGRPAEARLWLDRALAHDPAEAEARSLRAPLLAQAGQREAAWEDLAWARRLGPPLPLAERIPLWWGEAIPGLTLLLHPEGPLSLTLRLMRAVPVLAERGIQAILRVPAALLPLLEASGLPARFVAETLPLEQLPPADRLAALPDLPRLLGLEALPPLTLTLPSRSLPPLPAPDFARLRVGLVWSGEDPDADPAPAEWLALALVPGVALFGLDPAVPGVTDPTLITDLSPDLTDAAALAARLADLDLVIGRKSWATELAGLLGRPVWQIRAADECAPPLYPTMRFFTAPPLDQIAAALAEAVAARGLVAAPAARAEAAALAARGRSQAEAGASAEALADYGAALRRDPFEPDANLATGRLLARAGRRAAAALCFRRALAVRPDPQAALELSAILRDLGQLEAAAAVLETAGPASAAALALVRRDQGQLDAALALLATVPSVESQVLAELRLAAGQIEAGLAGFGLDRPLPPEPRWDGGALEGRRLVIEAGGDPLETVMLARYLPLAAAQGGLITLVAPAELAGLLAGLAGLEAVRPPGPPPEAEAGACYARLSDLPRLLGGAAGVLLPPLLPYLPPPSPVPRVGSTLRVGLVWGGVPRRTACPLEPLLRLAAEPGVSLTALTGTVAQGAAVGGTLLVEVGAGTFLERLAGIDLVIGGERLETHWAAAMGLPVWLIPPALPSWRWSWQSEDSFWYPSVRLFPRRPGEGWREPVGRIAAALQAVAAGFPGLPPRSPPGG